MPVLYEIDQAGNRLSTRCVGPITLAEVCAHFGELKIDPTFRPGLDVLLDMTECTSAPTVDQLHEVVWQIESLGPSRPFGACAIVASQDVLFGMSMVFESYAGNFFEAVSVFRTSSEAEDWLAAKQGC